VEYDNECHQKMSQKPPKQPQMKPRELDYVGYNGERDNVDYEWEKNDDLKTEGMIIYYNENNSGSNKKIHINESSLNLFINKALFNSD